MVWIKSESELRQFMNKNKSISQSNLILNFQKKTIEFLDTLMYIDSNNKLQTTLYRKPSDCQNYLHAKLAHPFSLKKVSLISITQNYRIYMRIFLNL